MRDRSKCANTSSHQQRCRSSTAHRAESLVHRRWRFSKAQHAGGQRHDSSSLCRGPTAQPGLPRPRESLLKLPPRARASADWRAKRRAAWRR
eukprot:3810710-Prymnesium_polylepis.1